MTPSSKPSRRRARVPSVVSRFGALLLACTWLLVGCNSTRETRSEHFGTESHFLFECDTDSDCGGDLSCLGGRCSMECVTNADCAVLADGATCTTSGSLRTCDLSCRGDDDCSALAASECTAGSCRRLTENSTETEPDRNDGAASPEPASPTDAGANPEPQTQDSDAGVGDEPDASLVPACTQPESAYEVRGECTVDLDCEMFVDDCGCGCLPGSATDPEDTAVAGDDGGSAPGVEEPSVRNCTTSVDCALATRIDQCCPGCVEAFSTAHVAAEDCVYGEGEEPPEGCTPSDCTPGCPGSSCTEAVSAQCVGGRCLVAVSKALCGEGTCGAYEYCVSSPNGLECRPADCEFDRCHPERCDQIGESCCDPLPGDGVNYCNAGLVCRANGCEAPAGVDPNRICNNVLCAEGDVCCDECTGACVNALSGAQCPNTSSAECADSFPCGPGLECSKSTQYCESHVAGPLVEPAAPNFSCVELPEACLDEPGCICLERSRLGQGCMATPEGGYIVELLPSP